MKPYMSEFAQQTAELTQALSGLAQTVNAEQLFVAAALEQSLRPTEQAVESELGPVTAVTEVLAFYLYPHFAATQELTVPLKPKHTGEAWWLADRLFNLTQLREHVAEPMNADQNRSICKEEDGFWPGQAVEQARLYASAVRSSAYPEQTRRHIEEIQGRFESWFESQIGIGPKRAVQLLWAITDQSQEKFERVLGNAGAAGSAMLEEWKQARTAAMRSQTSPRLQFLREFRDKKQAATYAALSNFITNCQSILVSFDEVSVRLEPPLTASEWTAFIGNLGMTPTKRLEMTSPEEVRLFPLYVLSEDRALVRDMGHTCDRIWALFDSMAMSDAKFANRYQTHRKDWLEGHAVEYLQRLFPRGTVFQEVLYPDPDNAGGQSELDALVAWGPFLLIVECKAKQFRLDAQLQRNSDGTVGDAGRLRSDLKANIEDAFQQAQRAIRYIEETEAPTFTERATRRTLRVEKGTWTRIYPLTLSLLSLADMANYRPSLRELGLFKAGIFPLSLAASELDIITQFCEGPEVFLHYVERRQVLHSLPYDVHSDELDVFGAYLQTRLRQEHFTRDEQPSLVILSGWTDEFDRWMSFQRDDLAEKPDIRLSVPDGIRAILRELRKRPDEFARWMAFALLDLSDELLHQIAEALMALHREPPSDEYRCLQFFEAQTVVVFVSTLHKTREELYQQVQLRATVEQYQSRATICLGFGIYLPDQSQPFDFAFWREDEWSYDAEFEQMMAQLPKRHLRGIKDMKLRIPGRNEPCFCGSGRKFKKCCLGRVST